MGAGGRGAGVEADVGGTCLEDREEGDDQVFGAARQHGDTTLRADTEAQQAVCEAVGAGVQLGVAEGLFAVDDSCDRGRRGDPGREEGGHGSRGRPGRRAVQPGRLRLLGQRDLDPAHRGAGSEHGGRETLREVGEPAVVGGEFGVRVAGGARVEVDADAVAVGALVDVDGEVLDRARGQVVAGGRMPGEPQLRPERHDVDDGTEEPAVTAGPVQLATQVLAPVPLVCEQFPGYGGGLAYEVVGAGVGAYGQPQREDVGGHARGGALGVTLAGGDGEAEDDVPGSGEPVQIGGGRGDQDTGPASARVRCGRVDQVACCVGEMTGSAQEAVAHPWGWSLRPTGSGRSAQTPAQWRLSAARRSSVRYASSARTRGVRGPRAGCARYP